MKAIIGLCFAVVVLAGCSAGHRMAASEFQYLHPAVRWVYKPGHQIGNCVLLFLPMIVPNDIAEVSEGPGCVIAQEVGSYAPELGFMWYKPSYAISLQDGRVLPRCPSESRKARKVSLVFLADNTPVARLGKGTRIVNRTFSGSVDGGPVFLESDKYGSVKLLHYGRVLSGPIYYWEQDDDVLIVAFRQMVLCIDGDKLTTQDSTQPNSISE